MKTWPPSIWPTLLRSTRAITAKLYINYNLRIFPSVEATLRFKRLVEDVRYTGRSSTRVCSGSSAMDRNVCWRDYNIKSPWWSRDLCERGYLYDQVLASRFWAGACRAQNGFATFYKATEAENCSDLHRRKYCLLSVIVEIVGITFDFKLSFEPHLKLAGQHSVTTCLTLVRMLPNIGAQNTANDHFYCESSALLLNTRHQCRHQQ